MLFLEWLDNQSSGQVFSQIRARLCNKAWLCLVDFVLLKALQVFARHIQHHATLFWDCIKLRIELFRDNLTLIFEGLVFLIKALRDNSLSVMQLTFDDFAISYIRNFQRTAFRYDWQILLWLLDKHDEAAEVCCLFRE